VGYGEACKTGQAAFIKEGKAERNLLEDTVPIVERGRTI
jgi:hypothetical protein